MNNSVSMNETFCRELPIAIGNKTFCGLTENWSPRFSHGALLAMTIVPVLVYWLVLFLMVKQLFKELHFIWRYRSGVIRGGPKGMAILLKYYGKRYPNDKFIVDEDQIRSEMR